MNCELFQMMRYIIILKVRKFHQPTANRFSTARQKPVGEGLIGLRYGLCLGIQRDQHLHALSGSVLSVQFSKSILELQLNTLDLMEVAYRPKPKHVSFLRNIFIKGTYQL